MHESPSSRPVGSQGAAALTPDQHHVLRESGTERPFSAAYKNFKALEQGEFHCVGCGNPLFSSSASFDSGCGWPAFYDALGASSVIQRTDMSHGMVRTEVLCAKCGGHLGHRFDGEGFPTPTDQRYCINACVLKHVPKNTR